MLGSAAAAMLLFRLQATAPQFSTADNPTARDPHFLTRLFTFSYLPVFNLWLLLYPNTLSFDWGMDAVPRVTSLRDPRFLLTVVFYVSIGAVVKTFVDKVRKTGEVKKEPWGGRKQVLLIKEQSFVCPCPVCHHSLSEVHSQSCRTSNNNNSVSSNCVCGKLPARVLRKGQQRQTPRSCAVFLLALAFLTLPFLPATNLLFYVGFVVAERVLYLPSAGLCLILGLGSAKVWEAKRYRKHSLFVLFIVLLVFGVRTVLRNRDWLNEESLYRAAVHVNPPKGKIYTCLLKGGLRSVCGIFMPMMAV